MDLNASLTIPQLAKEDISPLYFNQALMVSPANADWLQGMARTGLTRAAMTAQMGIYPSHYGADDRKPYEFKDGLATIRVRGTLEHGSMWYNKYWTGYDALRYLVGTAMEDVQVRGIAFVFNSGGGMVSGNFDLSDYLYSLRGKKPTLALVDEHAYSAAYSLATACERIVVARTGGVGSIGACAVLWNFSKALNDMGVTAEVIRSDVRKMKPNPLEPLEDEDRARVQAGIDHAADLFIATVARNTGLGEDVIRATQAATMGAEEAVEKGFAHAIATQGVDAALDEFKTELSGSTLTNGGHYMTTANNAGNQPGDTVSKNEHDLAVAAARNEGIKAGAEQENTRIMGILAMDEAKGRESVALALAKNPGMTVDSAKDVLAATPLKESSSASDLDALMNATGGGSGVNAADEGEQRQSQVVQLDAAAIYRKRNSATRH